MYILRVICNLFGIRVFGTTTRWMQRFMAGYEYIYGAQDPKNKLDHK